MTTFDTNPTRSGHVLDETIWRAVEAEVVATLTGTASEMALTHWEMHNVQQPEMPDYGWLVGARGWHPESGRPYNTSIPPGIECNSTNRTCYCAWHRMPIIGGNCTCPTHMEAA